LIFGAKFCLRGCRFAVVAVFFLVVVVVFFVLLVVAVVTFPAFFLVDFVIAAVAVAVAGVWVFFLHALTGIFKPFSFL
jgi:hypothetical protein